MTSQAPLERDILARFMYSFMLLTIFVLGRFGPDTTLAAHLYESRGAFGPGLVAAAGILAALIFGDTLINDWLPPEIQLKWTSKYRHLLCVAGALVFMCAIYKSAASPGATTEALAEMLRYFGLAGFGLWIGWRDVRRRPGHALLGV